MASPFDRLMTTIRPHLPGAIDEAIRQELFFTCTEFFRLSNTWQERLDLRLPANSREGEIMPYAGRIERLLHVEDLDGGYVRGAVMAQPDISGAAMITMPYHNEAARDFVAVVAMTVADPVNRDAYPIVPGEIVSRYTEELISGILSRMMAQPAKPYTNLTLAQYHLLKFKGGAARAKNAMKTGHTEGSQAWSFPQTFNRR